MRLSAFYAAAAISMLALVTSSPAKAAEMRGEGQAPLTKDANSTRALAEVEARKDVVRKLLMTITTKANARAVAEEDIKSLAQQIPSSSIITREPSVIGKVYTLAITVDVDGGWLTQSMKDLEIQLPSQAVQARIILVLDSYIGVGTDSSKPQSEVVEYRRDIGSSFSDKSIDAYSEKEKSASSESQKSAASARGSSAAGYSNRYGSAAGTSRVSGSAASSSKSSAAYSNSISAVSKANVQAESRDNTYYRKEVIYQGGVGKSGPAAAAAAKLQGELQNYDVFMEAPTSALNQFQVQEFSELQKGPWEQFRSFAAGSGFNYIVGGKLEIVKEGYNSDQRLFLCAGTLSVQGYGVNNATRSIPSNGVEDRSSGGSEEACQGSLAALLAKKLADKLGPQIQDTWRDQSLMATRTSDAQSRAASEGAEYNLFFKSPAFNFQSTRLVVSVLNGLESIQKPIITVSSGPTELAYRVKYKSTDGQDLGMAVLSALADKDPALGQSPLPTLSGQTVTVCLVSCQ